MADVTRKDRFVGTSVTRSLSDRTRRQARRSGIVTGLANTSADNSLAIDAAIAEFGTSHHSEDSPPLPLDAVSASKFARDKAVVDATFRHGPGSPPTRPTFSFAQEYVFGERLRSLVKIIDPSTTPATISNPTTGTHGEFDVPSGSFVTHIPWTVPVSQILAPTVLDTHPYSTVADKIGYVNADAVVINGVVRAPYTLRFDGVRLRPIDASSGVRWQFAYAFTYLSATWGFEYLRVWSVGTPPNDPPWNGSRYILYLAPPLTVATFASAFPTHDGDGPAAAP